MRKKRLARVLALLTATAMAGMTLAGCGGSGTTQETTAAGTQAAGTQAAGTQAASDEKPVVKVGVMCPLSGTSARFGELYEASITSAMKAIEEDGLLKDYTLEFEYVDICG